MYLLHGHAVQLSFSAMVQTRTLIRLCYYPMIDQDMYIKVTMCEIERTFIMELISIYIIHVHITKM